MGIFRKIKNLFIKEDRPLPSSDEFISGEKKDVEKILRELGLADDKEAEANTPPLKDTDSRADVKNETRNPNIGSLFFEEDEVDLKDLEKKSILESKRIISESDDTPTTSTDAFRDKIEENLRNAGSQLKEKGRQAKEKLDSFLDEVEKKSVELDEIEKQEKEKYTGPMDYRGKSLLDDKDDFFEKAKAFADGRPFPPKGMSIEKSAANPPNKDDKRKVYGFEDLDGDGDEIIDDAIIDEQE
jgi:hypothetical protein